MGIFAEVMAIRNQENADLAGLAKGVENFVSLRMQAEKADRQQQIQDLQMENIKSQIEARKPSALDGILERAAVFTQLREAALAGDQQSDDVLKSLISSESVKADSSVAAQPAAPQLDVKEGDTLDQFSPPEIKPVTIAGTDVNSLIEQKELMLNDLAGETDHLGRDTSRAKAAQAELQNIKKRKESNIGVDKSVAMQREKAAELSQRDFLRASAASDTSFDQALKFADKQMDLFGVRPGEFFGALDKLTPSQLNEFKDGFLGAGREAAALIARQIIPGVRAASITEIFSQSAAKIGSTLESSANNVAASMGNAFANILSQNIDEVDSETGENVKIQDIVIDPITGKPLSKLNIQDKTRAINELKRQFANDLEDMYLIKSYKHNPDLLNPVTQVKVEKRIRQDIRDQLRQGAI